MSSSISLRANAPSSKANATSGLRGSNDLDTSSSDRSQSCEEPDDSTTKKQSFRSKLPFQGHKRSSLGSLSSPAAGSSKNSNHSASFTAIESRVKRNEEENQEESLPARAMVLEQSEGLRPREQMSKISTSKTNQLNFTPANSVNISGKMVNTAPGSFREGSSIAAVEERVGELHTLPMNLHSGISRMTFLNTQNIYLVPAIRYQVRIKSRFLYTSLSPFPLIQYHTSCRSPESHSFNRS